MIVGRDLAGGGAQTLAVIRESGQGV